MGSKFDIDPDSQAQYLRFEWGRNIFISMEDGITDSGKPDLDYVIRFGGKSNQDQVLVKLSHTTYNKDGRVIAVQPPLTHNDYPFVPEAIPIYADSVPNSALLAVVAPGGKVALYSSRLAIKQLDTFFSSLPAENQKFFTENSIIENWR